MKKYLQGLSYLLVGLLLGSFIPIHSLLAEMPIKLIINGNEITCTVNPQIINNRVMVNVRDIASNLGADVSWDQSRNAVIINSLGEVINNTNTNSTITSNTTSPIVNPTVDPKNIVPLNTTSNNNQTNLAKTEKAEYIELIRETMNIAEESMNLMKRQDNPNDSEILDMRDKVQNMKSKLNGWGIVSDCYQDSKSICIDIMTDLDSALYTRNFIQLGGSISFKASSQLEEYVDKIHENTTKLGAEIDKIKKLNL
ncbi:MAG: copper amine oxidase N-terminal domain-containing protein [Candidatus Neomarinimicrobiota bacterium]